MKFIILSLTSLFLFGCSSNDETSTITNPIKNTPNILFIIADDLGKDAINGFSEGTIKPNTPNIDAIRNSGLSFTNFWSYPTCSPTRASILTGKYGYRTGVKWAGDEISLSETSLQKYINEQTNNKYSTAIIGKWHLSGNSSTFNPEILGIDYYAGLIRGEPQNYYNWLLTEDGTSNIETDYATTKFTDLATDWINQQEKPWFLWLAYNAPHAPFHTPPNDMHSQGFLPEFSNGMDETPYYMASIEAMDFQIGKLLENISEEERNNTVIIFIGDNGTPNEVAQSPYTFFTAKGSLNQGGINVPMFISGNGVLRTGNDENLITSTDLFSTIAQIAGVSSREIHDNKSFKSLLSQSERVRNFQYCEKNDGTNNLWTISNGDYKLFKNENGNDEFYDLNNDPYEQNNLLNETLTTTENIIKTELETELNNIRN
ncbi:sulfatase-like hydrolase/transferase [Aquimarina sp. 2201CG14-23]|uniref:sulfatase-like hydrolase/transferase n=1 Tax=Aquimarina mycalae TaxID=3040073 RepID=UPI002477DEED|nr:sulfatase-like hydrolase/transferase [Aquimarina sp. 2201CG14-23]MDH7444954.1 sulfatase-like hydrolase/transferase [Aquimarina sp. 2201CG14-23]